MLENFLFNFPRSRKVLFHTKRIPRLDRVRGIPIVGGNHNLALHQMHKLETRVGGMVGAGSGFPRPTQGFIGRIPIQSRWSLSVRPPLSSSHPDR